MSEYFDLSEYTYRKNEKNTLNIGWLEKKDFTKGKVSQDFLENLFEYIKCPIHMTRGIYHNLKLDNENDTFTACYQGYEILLGSAEIRVIDVDNKTIYASPDLILHYIINHNYLPPDNFIRAVNNGAKPDSELYSKLICNIYSNIEDSSRIKCPFCKSGNIDFGHKKVEINKYKNLQVLKSSCIKNKNVYEDCLHDMICKNCGRLFTITCKDIINCINNMQKEKLSHTHTTESVTS